MRPSLIPVAVSAGRGGGHSAGQGGGHRKKRRLGPAPQRRGARAQSPSHSLLATCYDPPETLSLHNIRSEVGGFLRTTVNAPRPLITQRHFTRAIFGNLALFVVQPVFVARKPSEGKSAALGSPLKSWCVAPASKPLIACYMLRSVTCRLTATAALSNPEDVGGGMQRSLAMSLRRGTLADGAMQP